MSALAAPAAPATPRPRTGQAPTSSLTLRAGQRRPVGGRAQDRSRRSGHLRLVTPDFVPEPPAAAATSSRRPEAPRPARQKAAAGTGRAASAHAAGASDLAELAPHHPAVRAQQRRRRDAVLDAVLTAPVATPARGAAAADARRAPARRVSGAPAPQARRNPAAPLPIRVALGVIASVLALVLIASAAIVASGWASSPTQTTAYTVEQGQSLWEIAAATGARDVAETVSQIVELNDLGTATIQPGQSLLVPVQ